jgi:hypothetical protein
VNASHELDAVVDSLRSGPEPDDELILEVGCGPLESLVRGHGIELWPRIEQLARDDSRFRRALSHVWAYESPEFDRRQQLLEELGEFWSVAVRFVAYPTDFQDPPSIGWRAWEVVPDIPPGQLPGILRAIADSIERYEQQEGRAAGDEALS